MIRHISIFIQKKMNGKDLISTYVTFDLTQTRVTYSISDLFSEVAEYFSYVIRLQKSQFASYKRCKSVLQSDTWGYKYAPDRLCSKNKKACVFSFLCLTKASSRPFFLYPI